MKIFAAVVALSLAACGGSAFEGRWSGVYTAVDERQTQGGAGSMDIEVTADGQLSGTLRNQTSDDLFSAVGQIDDSGGFEATFTLGTSVSRASGSAYVSAGHLTGTAKTYVGEVRAGSLSFDLSRL